MVNGTEIIAVENIEAGAVIDPVMKRNLLIYLFVSVLGFIVFVRCCLK